MEKKQQINEALLDGGDTQFTENPEETPTKYILFKSIRVYEIRDKDQVRTEIRSIKCGEKGQCQTAINVMIILVLYAICFVSETMYKETLLNFSLSEDGIPWIQRDDVTSAGVKKFFLILTKMGGGKEMLIWFILSFIFQRRASAIYVCSILALDKLINSYLKLLYANPRPYMVESTIQPIDCSTSFGSPSGHSSSTSMIATTLFLHTFHGYTHSENKYMKRELYRHFYGSCVYFTSLLVAMFWFFGIPFSRYLMGVHSLDQLLFGNSLGCVGGFVMHFVVRDHIIKNYNDLIEWQRKLDYIPCVNKEQDDLYKSAPVNQTKQLEDQKWGKLKVTICLIVYLLSFTYLSIATFFRTDAIYQPGSKQHVIKDTTYDDVVKNWNNSKCKEEEGEWDMTYSLQNACLNACGYQWFLCGIYIMTALRQWIYPSAKKYTVMDADSYLEFKDEEQGWNKEEYWFRVGFAKAIIMGALGGLCALPAIFLKLKTFESAGRYAGVIIMITNVVIPGFIVAFLFVGGPFDIIMMKVLGCGQFAKKK